MGEKPDCLCGDEDCRLWLEHGFFPTDCKPSPDTNRSLSEEGMDWLHLAKLAADCGVRFRTNAALIAFLNAAPLAHKVPR